MRRTLIFLITASLLASACGGSDADGASPDTGAPPSEDSVAAEPADAEPATTFEDVGPPPTNADKPTDINVPGVAPDELVITVLSEGAGPVAEAGDTVIVDYIGVRSLDGVEFDNSYDRFEPFPVTPLGTAQVIQGWNDGLLGAQAGARLQLDIPSDLAYGEAARSEIIRENEPLTFVIDVRSVVKSPDPADAPTEPGVALSEGATQVSFEDLVEGDGAVLTTGQTAIFNLVLFRGDNGVELDSTWTSEPIQMPIAAGQFAGIVEGMPGMKVGGRRAITIPPALGFGVDGNPQIGLPADADIILVIDLYGIY